jgi:hypothetical protein
MLMLIYWFLTIQLASLLDKIASIRVEWWSEGTGEHNMSAE